MKILNTTIKLLIISVILASALSCKKEMRIIEVDETIYFEEKGIGAVADLIDKIEFVALEDTAAAFIREASQVIVEDDRIYVRDMFTQKIIAYSGNGDFMYSIDRKGRGAGEYQEIAGFALDNSSIYLIDNYTNKLQVCNKQTGMYEREMNLPIVTNDIAIAENGDFLLTVAPYGGDFNLKQTPHRIFITDSKLKIREELLPYGNIIKDPLHKRYYFTADKEYIYFQAGMNDYFYRFSKADLSDVRSYYVDFGKNKIPDDKRNDYEACLPYRFMFDTPFVTGKYMIYMLCYGDYSLVCIYDKDSGKWYKNDEHERYNFIYPTKYVRDKIVYAFFDEGLDAYLKMVDNGFKRASAEIEDHLDKGGSVLLKYYLK